MNLVKGGGKVESFGVQKDKELNLEIEILHIRLVEIETLHTRFTLCFFIFIFSRSKQGFQTGLHVHCTCCCVVNLLWYIQLYSKFTFHIVNLLYN
jgi:hypothetical protein